MTTWASDLRVSVRQLRKAPGFTVAAIAVLAFGIGLNAAMFSVVYAVGIAGRGFPTPDRVVQLYSSQARETDSYRAFSYPAYRELASQGDLFAGVLAHNPSIVSVTEGTTARRTFAVIVSRNYFDVLGVPIVRGRGFTEEEAVPGRDVPVVIATYAYWRRTGFDPDLVGKTLRINERAFTVVGITPRGFTGTMSVVGPELFLPLGVFQSIANDFQSETARTLDRADAYNLFLVARLKDGVSLEAAGTRLSQAGPSLERAFPAEYRDARLTLAALPRFGTSTSPRDEGVVALLGAVMLGLTGAVLLTVCLNLASMLLARGRARRKEFAVRLALGAGRWRIVRQLLIEGLLLSSVGGVIGVAWGLYGVEASVGALASKLPVSIVLDGAVTPSLAGATVIFCVLATLSFALGPALRHSRGEVLADLKPQTGDDHTDRRPWWRPRNPLVVGQVALSLALLIAAGLFVQMVRTAVAMDFGFDADRTVMAEVDGSLAGLATPQTVDLYARITRSAAAIPGAESVAVGALVPVGMINMSRSVGRAGIAVAPGVKPASAEDGRAFGAPWNAVSSAYFAAMGVPILQGRPFTDAESFGDGRPTVAILDETLARKLWPEGEALGQRIRFEREASNAPGEAETTLEVVAIVASTHRDLFEKEMPGAVYVPFAQGAMGNAFFHVRPAGPSMDLRDAVRSAIRDQAPHLPLFSTQTFAAHVESSVEYWALRLAARMFGLFGALAMLVALVGIYGVMSYSVSRRTREIGIRMAMGALPGAVRRMVLGESLMMTLAGVGLGWLIGIGVGQALASVFVDVASFEAVTFTVVPLAFIAAAVAAAWLPARRATRVNPMTALRSE